MDKNDKNISISKENKLNNNNLYQKTSPNFGKNGLQKHFYRTNNNFKKTSPKKISKNINENEQKNFADRKAEKNKEKGHYKISKEIVNKNYFNTKNSTQDFDSNLDNIINQNTLNNNNKINKKKYFNYKINI